MGLASMRTKVVFLDRDGTVNCKPAPGQYLSSPAEIRYLPGVLEELRKLAEAGFCFVMATVQAGIGRGLVTAEEVAMVNMKMEDDFGRVGVRVLGWFVCPHRAEEQCDCRKPKPGLMLQAAKELNLELSECWNVGDSPRDILMGVAAGCRRNVFVRSGYEPRQEEAAEIRGVPVAENMAEVVRLILQSNEQEAGKYGN